MVSTLNVFSPLLVVVMLSEVYSDLHHNVACTVKGRVPKCDVYH